MPDASEKRGWFASLPNDSKTKTLIVAVALCLVCSVAVSMTENCPLRAIEKTGPGPSDTDQVPVAA